MNKIIACDHVCSGNCRRTGCNCGCGEFHQETTTIKVKHLASDFPSNVHSIEEMLAYIGKKTGFNSATMFSQIAKDEGDRTAADYADANPLSEDEE
jgi:hypothetical protein